MSIFNKQLFTTQSLFGTNQINASVVETELLIASDLQISGLTPSLPIFTDASNNLVSSTIDLTDTDIITNAFLDGQILIGSSSSSPVVGNITGTANQIIITDGSGSILMATPQDIGLTSDVSFNTLQLGQTSDQLVLGTTNTTTITAPAPSSNITLTLPNTTDTIVGRDTVDTLTNKTFSTDISGGIVIDCEDDNTGLTLNTIINTQENGLNFKNDGLYSARMYRNDATSGFSNFIIASGRDANIANLTDRMEFSWAPETTDTSITMFGTFDATSSSNGSLVIDGGVGIAKKLYVGTTITSEATTNQLVLGITNTTTITSPAPSSSITLTLPNTADTIVGRDTTDTLTNKTLTAPIISTISNTGTLTLPTITGTVALEEPAIFNVGVSGEFTDIATAITACSNFGGGIVLVAPDTYSVAIDTIVIPNNVTLKGTSREQCIITTDGTANGTIVQITGSNSHFSDFTIIGQYTSDIATGSISGFRFIDGAGNDCTIHNITIHMLAPTVTITTTKNYFGILTNHASFVGLPDVMTFKNCSILVDVSNGLTSSSTGFFATANPTNDICFNFEDVHIHMLNNSTRPIWINNSVSEILAINYYGGSISHAPVTLGGTNEFNTYGTCVAGIITSTDNVAIGVLDGANFRITQINSMATSNILLSLPTTTDTLVGRDTTDTLTNKTFSGTINFDNIICTNIDTGQGATEVYAMNQDVETTDAVTFATVNTGQGDNELYIMNQNVGTGANVSFNKIEATNSDLQITFGDTSNNTVLTNSTTDFSIVKSNSTGDSVLLRLTPDTDSISNQSVRIFSSSGGSQTVANRDVVLFAEKEILPNTLGYGMLFRVKKDGTSSISGNETFKKLSLQPNITDTSGIIHFLGDDEMLSDVSASVIFDGGVIIDKKTKCGDTLYVEPSKGISFDFGLTGNPQIFTEVRALNDGGTINLFDISNSAVRTSFSGFMEYHTHADDGSTNISNVSGRVIFQSSFVSGFGTRVLTLYDQVKLGSWTTLNFSITAPQNQTQRVTCTSSVGAYTPTTDEIVYKLTLYGGYSNVTFL